MNKNSGFKKFQICLQTEVEWNCKVAENELHFVSERMTPLTPKLVSMLLYTATRTIKNNLCKLKKSAVEKASIGLFTSCYDSRLFISQVLLLFASLDLSRVRPLTSGPPAFAPQKPEEKKKKKASGADSTSGSSSKENWSRRLEDLEGCLNVK